MPEGKIMAKTKSTIKEPKLKVKAALQNQPDLSTQLQDQFGFDGFKGPQEEIIESLLNGNDTFVIMQRVEVKVCVTSFRQ